ncbi:DEAD/DEAH box helicase [Rhodobacteraceae bacterium M382]|nr:DEAD/DEAH box helicase [Rhodobacteraceae bacterium M382]
MKQALADALQQRGYETLTPVQTAVTDPDLTERDLLVSAQTGSGKTVGFGLALAPTLLEGEKFEAADAPLALIIAPTRELALQVKRELSWLFANAGATLASCVGGMDMRDERRALARGAHIVVATPGRLRDHIMRGTIDLSQVRGVVLDEADEMLDLGFREDLEFILGEAPETRRTLMFSATVPKGIAALAQSYQKDAQRVTTVAEKEQHADIEYRLMHVGHQDAENAIINVLRYYEAPNAIVFANTRAMVNRLTTRLSNRGFSVVALSGELSQTERTHALQAMRDGRARVCVATDVAARGIDLPGLDLVIHAELPNNHETLLHRSGRTGRAGRKGVSALIAPPKMRSKATRLLRWAKLDAQFGEAPSADDVRARDQERMLQDATWHDAVTDAETPVVQGLLDQFTPEQIAAAYLRLYHAQRSAPEELSAADSRPERSDNRAAFGPSVWFSIAGGRDAGAEPRRYLPMLCKAGNTDRDVFGAIRVQDTETFVEIKETAVAAFLEAIGDKGEIEPGAVLKRLDKAPDLGQGGRAKFGNKPKPRGDKPKAYGDKPKSYGDKPKAYGDKPKPYGGKPKLHGAKEHRKGEGWSEKPDYNSDKPRSAAKKSAPKPRTEQPVEEPKMTVTQLKRPTLKGPQPPKGKPSSKKNKARKTSGGAPKGGDARPKRPPSKPRKS